MRSNGRKHKNKKKLSLFNYQNEAGGPQPEYPEFGSPDATVEDEFVPNEYSSDLSRRRRNKHS